MPAWKALLVVIVLGLVVATLGFAIFEDARPPFVERMFLQANGFGPAKTPNEALDKFKNAIRKRNYRAAATFLTGEYAEEFGKSVKKATQLGKSVDDLVHNVEDVANINSPTGKFVIRMIEPFPPDFKVIDVKYKEGDEKAYAVIQLSDGKPINLSPKDVDEIRRYNVDPRILLSLVPIPWNGQVELTLDKGKQGGWKLALPVSAILREKVQYLRDNGGNYVRALDNIKYAIKHEASTKLDFEQDLRKHLEQAK